MVNFIPDYIKKNSEDSSNDTIDFDIEFLTRTRRDVKFLMQIIKQKMENISLTHKLHLMNLHTPISTPTLTLELVSTPNLIGKPLNLVHYLNRTWPLAKFIFKIWKQNNQITVI